MPRRRRDRAFACGVVVLLSGILGVRAQEKPPVTGQVKGESIFTTDLAEVGLAGTSAVQRVTIAPDTIAAEHTHTGRSSIIVITQGAMSEVRGSVKNDYKTGDVIQIPEGVKHHVENHGSVPLVFIEVNVTAKK